MKLASSCPLGLKWSTFIFPHPDERPLTHAENQQADRLRHVDLGVPCCRTSACLDRRRGGDVHADRATDRQQAAEEIATQWSRDIDARQPWRLSTRACALRYQRGENPRRARGPCGDYGVQRSAQLVRTGIRVPRRACLAKGERRYSPRLE